MKKLGASTLAICLLFSIPAIAKTKMNPEARAAQKRSKARQKALKKYTKALKKERAQQHAGH